MDGPLEQKHLKTAGAEREEDWVTQATNCDGTVTPSSLWLERASGGVVVGGRLHGPAPQEKHKRGHEAVVVQWLVALSVGAGGH
mmetsp:Transcript_80916/g.158107  ORF Transcript_80916/g.158107 Transcript_80916/m.158107 type:complete len:84 (-) Transcript_80916:911-1162(-)